MFWDDGVLLQSAIIREYFTVETPQASSQHRLQQQQQQQLLQPQQKPVAFAAQQEEEKPNKRLAVVVSGSFLRFSLSSFLKNVAQSVVEQGHSLDYFVSLTLENAPAYRSELVYMNYITWDTLFGPPASSAPSAEHITAVMKAQFETIPNATLRHVEIRESVVIDALPEVMERRRLSKAAFPNDEDVDLRFPIVDLREQARNRTANANRNMLRLFYNQKLLWNKLRDQEATDGVPYDYVMIMRDDTEWLERFDLNLLIKKGGTRDVFIPSCDARKPPLHPMEINDHIVIAKRSSADLFGDYFSALFRPNLVEQCQKKLPKKIVFDENSRMDARGCNSEMILRHAIQLNHVRLKLVGQGYIPMQRVARVKTKTAGVQTCFHKYCQSFDQPLDNHGMQRCNELEQDIFE